MPTIVLDVRKLKNKSFNGTREGNFLKEDILKTNLYFGSHDSKV